MLPEAPTMKRTCATRAVKHHYRHRRHPGVEASAVGTAEAAVGAAVPVSPLFNGTAYFARITYTTGTGPSGVAIDAQDIATAIAYATASAGPISAYASQYGPNAVAIAPATLEYAVTLAGNRFNDAQLQQYVNAIAQANSLGSDASVVVLNPHGIVNTDADATTGVLGYHAFAQIPYIFVNVLSLENQPAGPFTLDDALDQYALALSHELAEMVVDPMANDANPEVCDPCAGNCRVDYRTYYQGTPPAYIASTASLPPAMNYDFFIAGIAQPSYATSCPAPEYGCGYPPPAPPP